MDSDKYKTIKEKAISEGYYSEKRSKFLAFAHHVDSVEQALEIVKEYRKKYYNARHCCYAYRIGFMGEEFRMNDDGEPSSTAGKPILGQIDSNGLTNTLIIVVRYFGGVKLGTSGLIVAYREASSDAIAHCDIEERFIEEQIKEHIQWIRFEFSTIVHSEVFRSVRFMLNCVPVINIEHRKFSQMLKGSLNIFPLPTKHHFLDIDYIIDGNQNRIDLKNHQSKEQGIVAVVRRGGVARLDNREATELLQYLLEVIKNEAAAFAAIGGNYTKDVLKEIFQHIASLEQRKDKQGIVKDNNTYLIISTTKSEEQNNCEVAFWHTSGAEGNGLRAGTKCSPPTQTSYFTAPATILKTSVGGRNRLTSEEKLLELRSALLSRGRIVTIADIEAFGMSHFKSAITAIEVTKGTKKEVSTTQGFSRTIDIYLTKNNTTQNISPEEWEYLKESFMLKLKSASANMYPYRLFEKR